MPKKILVIDDSPTALDMISSLLAEAGFLVVCADKGQAGVDKAVAEKPDLVIVDTLLPDFDGFEVCRRIRAAGGSPSLKIIMTTGSIDVVDAVKARRAGADDYTVKTSDLSPLVTSVKNLLK